jgi:hypothetical protein
MQLYVLFLCLGLVGGRWRNGWSVVPLAASAMTWAVAVEGDDLTLLEGLAGVLLAILSTCIGFAFVRMLRSRSLAV